MTLLLEALLWLGASLVLSLVTVVVVLVWFGW